MSGDVLMCVCQCVRVSGNVNSVKSQPLLAGAGTQVLPRPAPNITVEPGVYIQYSAHGEI